jgi:ATP-dependent Zn protease
MNSLETLAAALLKEETLEEDVVNTILKDTVLPKEVMLHSAA